MTSEFEGVDVYAWFDPELGRRERIVLAFLAGRTRAAHSVDIVVAALVGAAGEKRVTKVPLNRLGIATRMLAALAEETP